ncbi:MAG: L-fucose/L-arabinose isomerase family protein [Firmicutes bacterium]|nr:L-fucose/L-arabinose isomerase family protein [Bacillota bacterium]
MKSKIGILTFSDGRERVHQTLLGENRRLLDGVIGALQASHEVDVVSGDEIIHTPDQARNQARKMIAEGVHGTIFNYSIWSFPHLSAIAANIAKGPILLLSNLNPGFPGLVGMLAAGGSLDQIGIENSRVWGDIQDDGVMRRVLAFCRAARAVSMLKGQTYGLIGGRSMGMYTAVADPRQWQETFGVDIEHIDQLEVVRLGQSVAEETIERAYKWLTTHIGRIAFDENLTPEVLKRQLRHYYATKQIVGEWKLDFCGIKCQPEMSEHYSAPCLNQAFLNDPYDMDGPKEPFVCACEVDMDGALTMQVLKLLSGKPVLFFDFRHYYPEDDTYVFCNCGSQATWYAAASDDFRENLRKVTFHSQRPYYFPSGAATVCYMASPVEVTLARLMRKAGRYWMAIMPGKFVDYPAEKMAETSGEWPHCFVKLNVDPAELISQYGSNHSHAVVGNCVEELTAVCRMLGIEARVFG